MLPDYLARVQRFGMKLGLENMERLMAALHHPEKSFRSVHVAGTNGKGSVCAMLASCLREARWKVGLYTSPHLFSFNERIRIDGKEIDDATLASLAEEIERTASVAGIAPTFFEAATAMAFLHFARQRVDIAVVEVGLGGRLDATNVLVPELAVLTSIDRDHEEHLGSSLEKIAAEKAGIVKRSCDVVTGEQHPDVLAVIERACSERQAILHKVPVPRIVRSTPAFQVIVADKNEYRLPLLGAHQAGNASLALASLKILGIPEEAVVRGLENATWQGRMEVVSTDPAIIVDGAHNLAGFRALLAATEAFDVPVLVLALSKGKPVAEIAALLGPKFQRVIVTRGAYKPEDPQLIAQEFRSYCADVRVEPDAARACNVGKKGVVVTGSLYMIPDALRALRKAYPGPTARTARSLPQGG